MIGTIKPTWTELRKLGIRDEVTHSMCMTCNALASERKNQARMLISYDTIFLSLFSKDKSFTSQLLKSRPRRCLSRNVRQTDDGKYLANVSILISAIKISDDVSDGDLKLPSRIVKNVSGERSRAVKALNDMGLPTDEIFHLLEEYSSFEKQNVHETFGHLSRPIAECYEKIFSGLPSRKETDADIMGSIGRIFGELTLLIDAVEDIHTDEQKGCFNIWKASIDLPQKREDVIVYIETMFNKLEQLALSIDSTIAAYLQAAHNSVRERISCSPKHRKVASHPLAAMMAALVCFEQDCNGDWHLTQTGFGVGLLGIIACLGCCACMCKK